MNVRKLKELPAQVPDDAEVVTRGFDHSYVRVRSPVLEQAGSSGGYLGDYRSWASNCGWDPAPERLVDVLVIE